MTILLPAMKLKDIEPKDKTHLLEVSGLIKKFPIRIGTFKHGTLIAVDRVSFRVDEGETLGLVGESGCGKSTIGKCLLHLLQPDGGSIRFKGLEVSRLPERAFRPFRKHMQIVFQDPRTSFNKVKPIWTSIADALSLLNIDYKTKKRECLRLLEEVGLRPELYNRYPHQLSGGQLQRIAIARALAPKPAFVFLDEPTAALDMSIRGQIVNLLLDIQERMQTSYLLVSHDLRVVYSMAHKVMVMYLGEIIEQANKEELFARCVHPYTRTLFRATLVGRPDSLSTVGDELVSGEVIQVFGNVDGCKLFPRCKLAQAICNTNAPPMAEIGSGHYVRCWLATELATRDVLTGR